MRIDPEYKLGSFCCGDMGKAITNKTFRLDKNSGHIYVESRDASEDLSFLAFECCPFCMEVIVLNNDF